MKRIFRKYPNWTYIIIAFAFSWMCWSVLVMTTTHDVMQAGPPPSFFLLAAIGGIGPSVAGFISTALVDGRAGIRTLMSRFKLNRVGVCWIAFALLTTPVVGLLTLLLESKLGIQTASFSDMLATLPISLIYPVFAAFGEEFGWRGFLLPRLQKRHSALVASIILGVVWGLWHIPTQVLAFRQYGIWAIVAYIYVTHILGVTAQTIVMTWIHNNTEENLLVMILKHYSITFTAMFLFPLSMSVMTGLLHWFIYAVVYWVIALFITLIAGPKHLLCQPVSRAE